MKRSAMNARNVDSDSMTEHRYPWKWSLSDLKRIQPNGHTVFSCFSCGGGSTMGYKLAGYSVLGNCEIDPQMMKLYRKNHRPKYHFLMDIRDFSKLPNSVLPEELRQVVVLRFFAGYTQAETAAALDIPQGTAATRQRKALALLRLELGEEECV